MRIRFVFFVLLIIIFSVYSLAPAQGIFDPGHGTVNLGSDTIGILPVTRGGTNKTSITANAILIGNGISTPTEAIGTADQVFRIPGAGGAPAFGTVDLSKAAAVTGILANANTTGTSANTINTLILRDGSGNFSAGTITAALLGNASTAAALMLDPSDCAANNFATTIAANGNLTCAQVDIVNGTTGTLTIGRGGTGLTGTPTNGQLPIGNGAGYTLAGITGTANQITVTNGAGSVTLSTPFSTLSATATLDFDLSASASQDLTITVTGAVVGNAVLIGVPNGSVTADTLFWGWVSAADTVTIRAMRIAGAPDPASGTFRATVLK